MQSVQSKWTPGLSLHLASSTLLRWLLTCRCVIGARARLDQKPKGHALCKNKIRADSSQATGVQEGMVSHIKQSGCRECMQRKKLTRLNLNLTTKRLRWQSYIQPPSALTELLNA
jgi:hypothetical protein